MDCKTDLDTSPLPLDSIRRARIDQSVTLKKMALWCGAAEGGNADFQIQRKRASDAICD